MVRVSALGITSIVLALSGILAASPTIADAVSIRRVIDGDTVELVEPITAAGRTVRVIRLAGIDAPEVRRPLCLAERDAGQAARDALRRLLPSGATVELVELRRDKYRHRLDARIIQAGRDVGAELVSHGHARAWPRGTPKPGWCY